MSTHTLNSDVVAPTLGGHWGNFGSPFRTAGYYKDPTGHVHIRGVLQSTAAMVTGETIFTLPVGFRPLGTEIFAGYDVTGAIQVCRIDIQTTGAVVYSGSAGVRAISICLPPFLADGN